MTKKNQIDYSENKCYDLQHMHLYVVTLDSLVSPLQVSCISEQLVTLARKAVFFFLFEEIMIVQDHMVLVHPSPVSTTLSNTTTHLGRCFKS